MILDLETGTRRVRRASSMSSSSTTSTFSSSDSDSDHGPSRGNSANRLPSSSPAIAFSLGLHSSRRNTLRGTGPSSDSQSSDPSISVGSPSVTNSSSSGDSDINLTDPSHTTRASTPASNAAGFTTNSPRALTRQNLANHNGRPRIITQAPTSSRGRQQLQPVLPITPQERNNSRRSDAPSPSSPSVSSSIVTLDLQPTVVHRNRRPNVHNTGTPITHDEYQSPTPARLPVRNPDVVQSTTGATPQHARLSTSSSPSSSLTNTSASNHVINHNFNINITVSGRRNRSTAETGSPAPSTRQSRNTNSDSNLVTRSDHGSPSSSQSVMSSAENITELLAALEEVVARFNSQTAVSSPLAHGRRRRDSIRSPESRTLSPELSLTPSQVISTPSPPGSPSELSFDSPVIIYTPGSSGPSSPILSSTPQSESPVLVLPFPSPIAETTTGLPGTIPSWFNPLRWL